MEEGKEEEQSGFVEERAFKFFVRDMSSLEANRLIGIAKRDFGNKAHVAIQHALDAYERERAFIEMYNKFTASLAELLARVEQLEGKTSDMVVPRTLGTRV